MYPQSWYRYIRDTNLPYSSTVLKTTQHPSCYYFDSPKPSYSPSAQKICSHGPHFSRSFTNGFKTPLAASGSEPANLYTIFHSSTIPARPQFAINLRATLQCRLQRRATGTTREGSGAGGCGPASWSDGYNRTGGRLLERSLLWYWVWPEWDGEGIVGYACKE